MQVESWHISEDGLARPCEATILACRLGKENHFPTQESASAESSRRFSEKYGLTTQLRAGTTTALSPRATEATVRRLLSQGFVVPTRVGDGKAWRGSRFLESKQLAIEALPQLMRADVEKARQARFLTPNTQVEISQQHDLVSAQVDGLGNDSKVYLYRFAPDNRGQRTVRREFQPHTLEELRRVQRIVDAYNRVQTGTYGKQSRFTTRVQYSDMYAKAQRTEQNAANEVHRLASRYDSTARALRAPEVVQAAKRWHQAHVVARVIHDGEIEFRRRLLRGEQTTPAKVRNELLASPPGNFMRDTAELFSGSLAYSS